MLDPHLRPLKNQMFGAMAHRLRGLSPNAITAVSTVTGLAAAGLLLVARPAAALAVWLLSRVLDGLDGAVARATGRQTDLGGYLDLMGDFLVYAALPIALVLGRGGERGELIVLAFLLGSFYVNGASWMILSALLEKRGQGAAARGEVTSVAMPAGVIGGTETLVLYSLAIALPDRSSAIFLGMTVLVGFSAVQRGVWAWRILGREGAR